jgi:type I restriction enzyme S subunit
LLATVQTGIAKGKDIQGIETVRVPYLRVANVQNGFIDTDDVSELEIAAAELGRYLLRPGDVLMNEGGDFDKLGRGQVWDGAIDPCIHQNHVFAVRPHSIEPEWLALVTSADCGRFFFMTRAKQSTNLASISSTNLLELPVPCPEAAERLNIIRFVRSATAELNSLITEATQAITLLRERRAALISAAVTGKIDVRSLAPTKQEAA